MAQDLDCMQGALGLKISMALRHLEFDDYNVDLLCLGAILSLYISKTT